MAELMAKRKIPRCWRVAVIAAALGVAMFAGLVRGQKVGAGKGLKFSDYYDPPHETQMKSLLEGATALPQPGGRTYLVTGAKLQTFRENGEGEIVVETPQCTYDVAQRSVSSPGLLNLRTADGTFSLEGQGFIFQQANSTLFVSNRVHTIIHPELVGPKAASVRTNAAARPATGIDVFSDLFDYAEKSGKGIYRGNVRVTGTNLALTGGILTVLVPRSDRRLQSLTAETNVIVDFENIHATGQQATYSVDTDRVLLTGDPTWRNTPREGSGDELVLDRTNGLFRASGHAWLKMPGQGMATFGFLPQGGPPAAHRPAATNQFVEIRSDVYEIRTNSAVFRNDVRVIEQSDNQLLGKMNCALLTITFSTTNELESMVAENEVVIEQDTNRLSCGLLTLTFSGTNELQRMVAENTVIIEQDTNRFTAGKAVYTATNGMLQLTDSPAWQSGQRRGKGDIILVSVEHNEMTVQTNAYMRLPANEFGRSTALGPGAPLQTGTKIDAVQFAEIFCQEYSVGPKGALFQGKVRLDHPQMHWTCQSVTALAPPGGGRLSRIVAEQAVVFDLTDDKGQQVRGTGEKAVYTCGSTGTLTNELMELIGNPATLTTTNFTGRNDVFMLDLANHRLGAPGKSKYVARNLPTAGRSNRVGLPDKPLIK